MTISNPDELARLDAESIDRMHDAVVWTGHYRDRQAGGDEAGAAMAICHAYQCAGSIWRIDLRRLALSWVRQCQAVAV